MNIRNVSLVAALAGLLATAQFGYAQDAKEGKQGEKRGPMVQQQVDRMAEELKLNDQQKTKIKALLEDQNKKRQELRADSSTTPEQRREKSQAMREEMQKKMKEILTPDQMQKWEKMASERRKGPGGEGQGKGKGKNKQE